MRSSRKMLMLVVPASLAVGGAFVLATTHSNPKLALAGERVVLDNARVRGHARG